MLSHSPLQMFQIALNALIDPLPEEDWGVARFTKIYINGKPVYVRRDRLQLFALPDNLFTVAYLNILRQPLWRLLEGNVFDGTLSPVINCNLALILKQSLDDRIVRIATLMMFASIRSIERPMFDEFEAEALLDTIITFSPTEVDKVVASAKSHPFTLLVQIDDVEPSLLEGAIVLAARNPNWPRLYNLVSGDLEIGISLGERYTLLSIVLVIPNENGGLHTISEENAKLFEELGYFVNDERKVRGTRYMTGTNPILGNVFSQEV